MKKFFLFLFLASPFFVFSQDIDQFLLTGKNDAAKLTEKYVNPIVKGYMYGLNNGWYSSARTHKNWGFDITLVANLSQVPNKEQAFQLVASDYENKISLSDGTSEIQTLIGESNNNRRLIIEVTNVVDLLNSIDIYKLIDKNDIYNVIGDKLSHDQIDKYISEGNISDYISSTDKEQINELLGDNAKLEIDLPDGLGEDLPMKAIPSATLQLGFGLPCLGTDLKVRYLPTIETSEFKIDMIGFGLQKSLTNILGLKDTRYDVSALAGFTKLNTEYSLDESSIAGDNQKLELVTKAFTFQVLAGVNYKFIEFYGSLGYNKADLDLDLKGTYSLDLNGLSDIPGEEIKSELEDPISLKFDASGLRATIGTRLNLGFFKIFGDYTIQEYNTITGGIALSFR